MVKDETYEEPPKGNRRNDKEINRCNLLPMIAKETLPALQWPALPRQHVDRDRRLRDIDAQFQQLTVNRGSAPQWVLNTHSSDQVEHLFANPWPAAAPTGIPLAKCRVSHAMPTDNRRRPDDGYSVKNAREAAIEPNEQRTVNPTQMQSAWGTMLQDIELMPQSQDFG